ncbi:hypothetical protein [Kitasatospora sp. NBC_01300]|uniref:hypothetical protein n=1 Tax=Kitasatospora sp. NBC_01300 TaxID=2903574 RepID=UPI00352E3C22|nr:hypothetical protein OG556_26000 [Kitasatospora sp. NBC_01300]
MESNPPLFDVDPLKPEGASAELAEALEAFSAVLADICSGEPGPLTVALSRLTEADIEHSLNSTPVQWRRSLLSTLRIPIDGARVNRALCRDVLTRMQRSPDGERAHHAAHLLTHPLFHDVAWAGSRHTAGVSEDTSRPLTHRWSPALLRLTVWSSLEASVAHAPLWSWALQQPWITDMGIPVKAVLGAARRVVELAPDRTSAGEGDDEEGQALYAPEVRSEETIDSVDAAVSEAGPASMPDTPQLNAALRRIADGLGAAVEPARRTMAAITEQSRPADADLAALVEVATAFDEAVRGLRAHGVVVTPNDLANCTRETDVVVRRLTSAPLRERLGDVARLTCRPGDPALAQDLETARERAGVLVGTVDWGASETEDAEALNALLTMVELHAVGRQSAEIIGLFQTAAKSRGLAYPAGRYQELLLHSSGAEEPGEGSQTDPESSASGHQVPVVATEITSGAVTSVRTVGDPVATGGRHDDDGPIAVVTGAETVDAVATRPTSAELLLKAPAVPVLVKAPVARPGGPEPEPVHAAAVPQARGPRSDATAGTAEDVGSESRSALARLIAAQRYGLAASLADSLGEPQYRITALQIAACAEAVRSPSSESISRIRIPCSPTRISETSP